MLYYETMNFTKKFEIEKTRENRIPMFFKARGYKLEGSFPGDYRFSRGSSWIGSVIRDIKSLPTKIEVLLTEKDAKTLEVLVLYDIDTLNKIISRESQEVIKAELQSLEEFCQKAV
jgi:hypothetical protein